MKTLVLYHSQFGNTRTLAEAIADTLRAFGPVRIGLVTEPDAKQLDDIDLLVIGGPTQGHGVSEVVGKFLAALKVHRVQGVKAATFDTRLRGPEILWGSAAKGMAVTLKQAGVELVAAPESFLVVGAKQPELAPGELERARVWAEQLGKRVRVVAAGAAS
jgi:flavodoxin